LNGFRYDGVVIESEVNWPAALRAAETGEQAAAVRALRELLQNGLRVALQGRGDVSEAHLEDFAQESLLRVLDRLGQFEGRSKFTTWALAIALNVAFTELRRKRWQDVSLEALLAAGEHLGEPAMLADEVLGGDEERMRLVAVLRKAIEKDLTPKQRAAILGELRELPFDQIVALLGTSRSAAYKMLHDARRALKQRLLEAGITGADIQSAFNL
jgi:RNA polymerase sigma-70 factor (ECF subfamily)